MRWFFVTAAVDAVAGDVSRPVDAILDLGRSVESLRVAAERSGYRVDEGRGG